MAPLQAMRTRGLSVARVAFVAALGGGITLAIACGDTGHPDNGTVGNVFNDPTACATEGAVQGCRIALGTKNGI